MAKWVGLVGLARLTCFFSGVG